MTVILENGAYNSCKVIAEIVSPLFLLLFTFQTEQWCKVFIIHRQVSYMELDRNLVRTII